MIFYHHGAAFEATTEAQGHAFESRAFILEEDGERTLLGTFGSFASRRAAAAFAKRYAIAFADEEAAPYERQRVAAA
jgi:hypothetical protein